jgi:hypothetical protein
MKHIFLIFSLGLAFSSVGFTAQAEPSSPSSLRKVFANITSPITTLGAISAAGIATDLAVKHGCGFSSPIRPWLVGAAAAFAGYKLYFPASHVVYTLLANDSQKLIVLVGQTDRDKGIMHHNEETIKEILREILYVKNKLIEHYGNKNKENEPDIVMDVLGRNLFLKDLPRIIGDTNHSIYGLTAYSAREVLRYTGDLVPKKDTTNSHWWSTGVGKAILSTRDFLAKPYVYARNFADRRQWNFKKDDRLLVTLGGAVIEEAAENLIKALEGIYNQEFLPSGPLAQKMFAQFYDAAETLIRYADLVLQDLKAQRQAIQRVRDVVFLFRTPSFVNTSDELNDYSMNVLSQIYQ